MPEMRLPQEITSYIPIKADGVPSYAPAWQVGGLVNVSSRRPATFRRHHRTIITPTAAGYFTKSRCGSGASRRASGTTGKEVFVSACPAFSRTTGAQPAARNQGRYRAAIREFLQGEAEGVNLRSRPMLSPP